MVGTTLGGPILLQVQHVNKVFYFIFIFIIIASTKPPNSSCFAFVIVYLFLDFESALVDHMSRSSTCISATL